MARKKDAAIEEVVMDEADASEVRVYEIAFHLEPEMSDSDAKKAYDAMHDIVTANGILVAEGTPEKVQLAYTISRSENSGRRDFDSAFFCWIAYEANKAGHEAVNAAVADEKRIIRFLDIRTTKEEAKHSAEMREFRDRAPEKAEEGVSDTELDAALEEATA